MELDQYFRSASENNNPVAIFDEHHRLLFKNNKFDQKLIKNVNSDFLVSSDSFLKKENLIYYTNKIQNIYIVMATNIENDCYKKLKNDFMNFKSSVVKAIAINICQKIQQNKKDICDAVNDFDQCVLESLSRNKPVNFYNIIMLPIILFLKP